MKSNKEKRSLQLEKTTAEAATLFPMKKNSDFQTERTVPQNSTKSVSSNETKEETAAEEEALLEETEIVQEDKETETTDSSDLSVTKEVYIPNVDVHKNDSSAFGTVVENLFTLEEEKDKKELQPINQKDYELEILFLFQPYYSAENITTIVEQFTLSYVDIAVTELKKIYYNVKLGFAELTKETDYCHRCPVLHKLNRNLDQFKEALKEYQSNKKKEKEEHMNKTTLKILGNCATDTSVGWTPMMFTYDYKKRVIKLIVMFVEGTDEATNISEYEAVPCFFTSTKQTGKEMARSRVHYLVYTTHEHHSSWAEKFTTITNTYHISYGSVYALSKLIDEAFYFMENINDVLYNLYTFSEPAINPTPLEGLNNRSFSGFKPGRDSYSAVINKDDKDCCAGKDLSKITLRIFIVFPYAARSVSTNLLTGLYDYILGNFVFTVSMYNFKQVSIGTAQYGFYDECHEECSVTSDFEIINKAKSRKFRYGSGYSRTAFQSQIHDLQLCLNDEQLSWTKYQNQENTYAKTVVILISDAKYMTSPALTNFTNTELTKVHQCANISPETLRETMVKRNASLLMYVPIQLKDEAIRYFRRMRLPGGVYWEKDTLTFEGLTRLITESVRPVCCSS